MNERNLSISEIRDLLVVRHAAEGELEQKMNQELIGGQKPDAFIKERFYFWLALGEAEDLWNGENGKFFSPDHDLYSLICYFIEQEDKHQLSNQEDEEIRLRANLLICMLSKTGFGWYTDTWRWIDAVMAFSDEAGITALEVIPLYRDEIERRMYTKKEFFKKYRTKTLFSKNIIVNILVKIFYGNKIRVANKVAKRVLKEEANRIYG